MRDLRTPERSNTPMHVHRAKDYQLHKKRDSDLWFQGDIDDLSQACETGMQQFWGQLQNTPVLDFGI